MDGTASTDQLNGSGGLTKSPKFEFPDLAFELHASDHVHGYKCHLL